MMKRTLLAASALALTLVGAPGLTGVANAQSAYGYVASGENAGGSVTERAALNRAPLVTAGVALASAAPVDVNNGAYTDPTPYVRQSLTQEHMYLGHSNAVRSPGQAAFASEPRAYSAPVWSTLAVVGKDLSIGSQR